MKQLSFRLLLLPLLLAAWGARAQTSLLQSQSFENGEAVNYTATSLPQDNTDNCDPALGAVNRYCSTSATRLHRFNQYFQRVNETTTPYTLPTSPSNVWPLQPTTGAGLDGTYFWAAEGTRGGQSITARPPAVLRLNSISSVAGKANLQVKVALLAGRASAQPYNSTNDSIRVQVRLNGGSTWNTIGEFTGDANGNMAQTKGNSSNPATLTEQMTDFTFDVGSSATSMETRVVVANRTSEELAFDNIRVYGTAVSGTPPVVANVETTSLSYAEGQAATPVTQTITVSDTDSPTLSSAKVQFTSGYISTEDELVFTNQPNVTGSFSASTGVLTLTGPASLADFQAALRAVSYRNSNTITARAGDRTVSFAVTDPTNLTSSPAFRTIAVTTLLDAASGLPYQEDLETNGEGTRYASNNASAPLTNGRAFVRTSVTSEPNGQWHSNGSAGTTISGINNSNYWWASGTSVLSGGVGTFITKQINTAGYTNLNFSVKLAASNNVWEKSQFVRVSYRLGGSSGTWLPLISFRSTDQSNAIVSTTGNLARDADPTTTTGVPAGAQLTPTLTTYSATLPAAANGQLVDFKIDALSSASDGVGEVIAFDNLQLTGTATTTVNSIVRASTNPTNATTVNYTVTFGAAVTGLTGSNFSLATTGTVSGTSVGTPVAGANNTWTVPVNTGSGSGTLTLSLASDAGLSVDITNTLPFAGETYTIDKVAPAAPVVTFPANGSSLAAATPTYTGTAEANSTVTVIVDGTSIGTTTASGAGSWSLTQPTALTQTSHTVRATATDAAGNTSPSSSTNSFTVDMTRPGVTISSAAGANNGNTTTTPIPFTVTFTESVTGFLSNEVTVTGGSLSGFVGSGTTYTFNVTPSGSSSAVTVNVAANVATDAANNGNTAAAQFTINYQQRPAAVAQSVTLNLDAFGNATLNASSVNSGSTGGGTLTYTIQKIVYGLVDETPSPALTLTTPNGANFTAIRFASYGTPTGTNGNYQLGSCNAANSLAAAQNAYVGRSTGTMYASNTDTRNNPVLGDPCGGTPKSLAVQAAYSADAASLTYDCTEAGKTQYVLLTVTSSAGTSTSVAQVTVNPSPTATISSVSPTSAPRGTPVTVAGTNLSGVSSLTVNGATATVSNLSSTGFTFVVPNTATFGPGSISVAAPCAQTLTNSFSVTAPAFTATVSTTVTSPTSTAPIPFSAAFSQSVGSTFTAADVTVAGGTLTSGSFSGSGAGPYTFTVTPSGTGTVSVSLAANVAQDANNTGNTASNTVSVQYNQPVTTTPTLNFPANNGFVRTSRPEYRGTAVAGSLINIFRATGSGSGVLTDTTYANSLGNYHKISNAALADGQYSVYVTATASGQATSSNSTTNTFTVDTMPPTVTLSSTVANSGTTSTSPVSFTATFSEPVVNFTSGGIQVSNGSVTSGPTAGSGNAYTFQVTPSAVGTVTVQVRANAALDQAGNNSAVSSTYAFAFQAPTITVGPSSLAIGQQGVAYSQALSATGGMAPYTFAITAGALPAGLSLVNGTIAGTPTTNGTFNFTVTATDASTAPGPYSGSQAYSLVIAAPASTATTWTGTISTDWFTAGNWTQGVPTATIDATIPTAPSGGRFPNILAGTANVRNLTFNSGATLTQSGGTLAIAANLTNNGTFLPTSGTVVLGNTATSNVLGSSNVRFWNLTVGTNGAQLSTPIGAAVQRLLTLNGTFATNGNSFVLESNNTLTALVVNNGSNVVTGTVTVQRAIDPSVNPGLGYRHYSAPVSNATVGDLATSGFTPVVNPAFNTVASPYTIRPYPTVYGYDDSRLTLTNNLDMFDKGYFSPGALSDPLAVGKGYTVNIAASEVVDFQGTLNNGDLSLNLTSTRNTYPADGGWQFLGNPYPAPLNYSQVAAADRSGLESAIYIYSSTSQYQGYYRVYINGIGNPVVPLGQGFFTRVASGNTTANMTFRNSQRLTAPNGTTLQRTAADPRPLVQLTLQGQGAAPADEAYVYFENGATSGFDLNFDAEKLPNPTGFNLSTTQAGKQLSVDGQPELGTTQRVVPLAVGVPAAGVYTLAVGQLLNLSAVPVYLRDRQLNTLTDLRQQPTYQFTVVNAAALNTARFELVFSPQQVLATVPVALAQQVAVYPNPAMSQTTIELPAALSRQPATATLLDALGRVVRQQPLPAGQAAHVLPLTDLATGVYSLRLATEAGVVVKKLVVE